MEIFLYILTYINRFSSDSNLEIFNVPSQLSSLWQARLYVETTNAKTPTNLLCKNKSQKNIDHIN